MHILIGQMTLWLALLLASVALLAALAAFFRADRLAWNTARDAMFGSAALAVAAAATLLSALIQNDFSLVYVAANSDLQLPLVYRLSALWRDAGGSLLLWAALLAVGTAGYLAYFRRRGSRHQALVVAGIAIQMILLLALLISVASPFVPAARPPIDGDGMRLLLQVWAMVIHPPATFAAYAAFGIAAAISVAALATRQTLRESLPAVRVFLLIGWLTMTAGIAIGGYWAYTDLGWGNFWSWDAVENTSLVPWLLATAALHTLRQAPAGRLTGTTHGLSITTLVTCFIATFVARGGISTGSRHSYAPSPVVSLYLAFIVLLLLVAAVLLIRHLRRRPKPAALNASAAAIVVSVGILALFASAVLIGTVGPGLPDWLRQNLPYIDHGPGSWLINVTGLRGLLSTSGQLLEPVATERFDRLGAVFGITLLAALGVCPWLMRSSTDRRTRILITNAIIAAILGVIGIVNNIPALWIAAIAALGLWIIGGQIFRLVRGRRRLLLLPGVVAHLATVMVLVAIVIAQNTSRQGEATLRPGQESEFAGMTVRYDHLERTHLADIRQHLTTAHLTLLRDGREVARLEPAYRQRLDSPDQRGEIHLAIGLAADVLVTLKAFDEKDKATFLLRRRPGMLWIWIGSTLLIVAGGIALAAPSPAGRARQEEQP